MGFLNANRRRTVRSEGNPFDKSTVVSIFPKQIIETKPTIQPSTFEIPAGSYDKPAVVIVGSASWWREIDEEQPLLEIPVSSVQVADSIVRDYCNGMLACDMGESMPGLFFIPGEVNLEKLKKDHKPLLDRALQRQKNWYFALVKLADALWARSNGNPLAVADDMRLAARELGIDKDWIKDYRSVELVRCVACGSMRNPQFPVCPICKAVVDSEAAKKLNLVFAQ